MPNYEQLAFLNIERFFVDLKTHNLSKRVDHAVPSTTMLRSGFGSVNLAGFVLIMTQKVILEITRIVPWRISRKNLNYWILVTRYLYDLISLAIDSKWSREPQPTLEKARQ